MFYLYQSNRLELLFDALCRVMDVPLTGPLVPEVIVVQNPGMARWLSRQIALHNGIAANMDFPLPARFIWQVFSSQLQIPEDVQDFTRQALLWRIYGILTQSIHLPVFADLQKYLQDDQDGRKAYQLAGRIADLFDQYLVYRPDMLTGWQTGQEDDWQAALWRMLTEENIHHRAGLLQKFLEKYRGEELNRETLPERITVFGVSSLAPSYLEVIQAVAQIVDVHLFHLSPCRSYWFDLVSDKELARKRSEWRRKQLPDVSEYYTGGPSLLSALGAVGREFSLQLSDLIAGEKELYEKAADRTLLARVQNNILDLVDPEESKEDGYESSSKKDRSIQFHICHSRMREIQVLHDRLLDMFERDPNLTPGDILVMAPDIESYDAAIRAVFESAEKEKYIPWSIVDRSIRREQPLTDAFLALLELLTGRFESPEVIAFLENDPVLRRFAIESTEVRKIRTWIRESGIRWGINAEHRQEFGCSMSDLHSWSFGLKRMFLGFVAGAKGEMFADIAPYSSLSTGESILLGKLAAFVERLQQWKKRIHLEKTVDEWAELLYRVLDEFFDPGDSENDFNALLNLREAISEWRKTCQSAGIGTLSLAVVRCYLIELLSADAAGQSFFFGRVTFCNMVPMRSVPFSVIWLLGMNDTEYPRSQRPVAFNLISSDPRTGDRNRRNDDCYLFLEALISARKIFSVSWIGRDQQDNSVRVPSVVVVTLLDYLEKCGYIEVGENFCPPAIEYPLQPFSPRCFDPLSETASYATQWLPGKKAPMQQVFLSSPLPPPEEDWQRLGLPQFLRFWTHPVRFFLQDRLGLNLGEEDNQLPEKEPFQINALERYHSIQDMANYLLKGRNIRENFFHLQASGSLPHGSFGRKIFDEMATAAEEFVTFLQPLTGKDREDLEIDLKIGPFILSGWLGGINENGLIRYRAAKVKAMDMLRLWVEHLVYNLVAPEGYRRTSHYAGIDKVVTLQPVNDPREELSRLVHLYALGLTEPLRFYPRTSHEYFLAQKSGKTFDYRKTWETVFKYPGEGDDPAYRLAFKGVDPFEQPFAEYAMTVYHPLDQHVEEENAGV